MHCPACLARVYDRSGVEPEAMTRVVGGAGSMTGGVGGSRVYDRRSHRVFGIRARCYGVRARVYYRSYRWSQCLWFKSL